MATQAQITSVINLHGIDDRLTILAEYPATAEQGDNLPATTYDIGSGGSYKDQDGLHGMGDPYELAAAQLAQVIITVTPAEGDSSLNLNSTSPISVDLNASLTYKGDLINVDSEFNFITIASSLTVNSDGLVTYDGTGTGQGDVRIEWKKDTTKFAVRTVTYTP